METITAVKTKNGLVTEDMYNLAMKSHETLLDLFCNEGLSRSQQRSIRKTLSVLAVIVQSVEEEIGDPFTELS